MIGRATKKPVAKPAPRKPAPRKPTPSIPTPVKPGGGTRGNVEQNYRGIPGLVNATAPVPALGKKPTPSIPTPVTPPKPATGIRSFDDPKMVDDYLGNVARAKTDPSGSFNLPSNPAGGGATSFNRIDSPGFPGGARPAIPTPVNPSPGGTVLPSNPAGGVGTTGFKSGSGGFASNLFGTGMKKGGKVKAASAPKASSASKRGDGIATKGKTKGRFV